MPIVPAVNIAKSLHTGTPYSPAVSFNPDKKLFFDTHITTLGVLAGGPVTSDGTNVTIPAGFTFIHNGIIIKLLAPFVIAIPGIAFPKFIVASNADETPGSAVTIEILGAISPPSVLLGTISPNNSIVIQAHQCSIRSLCEGALAGGSLVGNGIVSGLIDGSAGPRQVTMIDLVVSEDGVLSPPINGTIPVPTNISGMDRWDLVQWNGAILTIKPGTPFCPSPDPGNIPIAVVLIPNAPANLVRSMNKQMTVHEPVIVAYYYANGGLHASRVGVTFDPFSASPVYVDAEEMELSLYYPRTGFRYELNWDTMIRQFYYGPPGEGAFIDAQFDGVDEDDNVITRGHVHTMMSATSNGPEVGMVLHYNRLITEGSHRFKGRWRIPMPSAPESLSRRRRRIWVVEVM